MNIHSFQELVWNHYGQHMRTFPWRETQDPYAITVSEIMLQQTQTDRVVPKYEKFLEELPTWESLAEVPVPKLLSLWQGLGYNRRALNLKRMAEVVVNQYGGVLPLDREKLLSLPGIGPYTSGAIAAFAFHAPEFFIETNIRRVFIHHFFADQEGVSDKQLFPLIEQAVQGQKPREWYYALMDYGSWLAKQLPNPNRRSAHYTKQSTFTGSMRQLRGKILRVLLDQPKLSKEVLYRAIDDSPERTDKALSQLASEGFLVAEADLVYLTQ